MVRTGETFQEQVAICKAERDTLRRGLIVAINRLDRMESSQYLLQKLIINQSNGIKYGPEKMDSPKKVIKDAISNGHRPTVSIPTPYNGPIEINIESRLGKTLLVLFLGAIGVYISLKIYGGI